MQLFILVMINVFMGVALYLVISLKLERSASDFRQNRLRREMDEIIKEFNATAERNISLLEHKIHVMKRLMEKSGEIRSLDITVDEDGYSFGRDRAPVVSGNAENLSSAAPLKGKAVVPESHVSGYGNGVAETAAKKSLPIFMSTIINKLHSKKNSLIEKLLEKCPDLAGKGVPVLKEQPSDKAFSADINPVDSFEKVLIAKDLTVGDFPEDKQERVSEDIVEKKAAGDFDDEELDALFSEADDRYALIASLYNEGCSMDRISRFSGMPAGEIRLILNLRGQ